MSRKSSRKSFKKAVQKTHKKNLQTQPMRGGFIL